MAKIDYAKLEAALAIDEDALEEGHRDQPQAFYQVAKALALATSQRDGGKKALEETEAEVDLRHRQMAAASEEKITEPGLKSKLALNAQVKAARDRLLKLDHRVKKLTALKEAFEMRSFALNKLVDLYIHNYYGEASHRAAVDTVKSLNARQARAELRRERQ